MRLAALLLALLPSLAQAGAWPRPVGELYVLLSHETVADWTGLYAEWGAPGDLTFGLDIGGRAGALAALQPDGEMRSRAFVRVPVLRSSQTWRFALEAGIGQDMTSEAPTLEAPLSTLDRLSLGAAAGRGYEARGMGGWISLEGRMAWGDGAPDRTTLGGTLGIKPTARDSVEIGAYAEALDGHDPTYAAGPTWEHRFGGVGARLGVAFTDRGETRWRIGLATTF